MNSSAASLRVFRNPNERTKLTIANFPLLTLVTALVLAANPAQAGNLLVNPGFEANSGHVIPVGWTRFAPPSALPFGNYWVESVVAAHSGTFYWKQWGASYLPAPTNNVAGIYQDFSSGAGSTYQASGWFYTKSTDLMGADCMAWIEVSFLGASSNLLALYKSDNFSASVGTDTWFQYPVTNACDLSPPVSTGDPYFTTYAVTGSVSQLVAPIGTTTVRYRYAYLQAGSRGRLRLFRRCRAEPGQRPGPARHQQPFPAEHDLRQSQLTASPSTSVRRAALPSTTAPFTWS